MSRLRAAHLPVLVGGQPHMGSERKSFFDPEAPGLRGMVGIVLTSFGLIF